MVKSTAPSHVFWHLVLLCEVNNVCSTASAGSGGQRAGGVWRRRPISGGRAEHYNVSERLFDRTLCCWEGWRASRFIVAVAGGTSGQRAVSAGGASCISARKHAVGCWLFSWQLIKVMACESAC